jgi:hypothetical protein
MGLQGFAAGGDEIKKVNEVEEAEEAKEWAAHVGVGD